MTPAMMGRFQWCVSRNLVSFFVINFISLFCDINFTYLEGFSFWFEVFYDGVELPLPQTEEGIESVEWKKENEIPELLENSYPNIKLLMDNYLNLN